ncbi:GNAT family N-acetyltransferase [Mumia zhuanghuii]|uniref:GNAT family N-acetyltransferase n=2 Tax=Mumia TaxID=1546255 RepID=A0ABW1QR68_9ACTN|nr:MULTISPECIES: GNAT family N-acetyltransferase [Mumia]KAA1422429.1 GNAT family N-acetyltransferase [Mumia zhuanghuii]
MADLSIRPARQHEATALIAFWEAAGENDARPVDTEDAVRRLMARDAEALVVAERAEEIVGSLIVGWDGWRFHLYRLAVGPEARRSGVARRLVAHAQERAREVGAGRIDAMVLEGNALGAAFWESCGFHVQEDWRRWVHPL